MKKKSMFDPTLFNFEIAKEKDWIWGVEFHQWITYPIDGSLIGKYHIEYNESLNYWFIKEIVSHNNKEKYILLYSGRIPDNDFAFQLFKNMELELPVIRREIGINSIISNF